MSYLFFIIITLSMVSLEFCNFYFNRGVSHEYMSAFIVVYFFFFFFSRVVYVKFVGAVYILSMFYNIFMKEVLYWVNGFFEELFFIIVFYYLVFLLKPLFIIFLFVSVFSFLNVKELVYLNKIIVAYYIFCLIAMFLFYLSGVFYDFSYFFKSLHNTTSIVYSFIIGLQMAFVFKAYLDRR